MNIPGSREELEGMGFTFQRRTKCGSKLCGATCEWWCSPSGRNVLFRLHPRTGKLIQHSEECPGKKEFQSKPVEEKPVKEVKAKPKAEEVPQRRLFS